MSKFNIVRKNLLRLRKKKIFRGRVFPSKFRRSPHVSRLKKGAGAVGVLATAVGLKRGFKGVIVNRSR